MKKSPSLRIQQHWHPIFKAYQQSGMGVAAFCEEHGICSTSFYARRKQLKATMLENKSSGFIRLANGNAAVARTSIPSVSMIKHKQFEPLRIQTPNGYQVEFCLSEENGLDKVFSLLKAL